MPTFNVNRRHVVGGMTEENVPSCPPQEGHVYRPATSALRQKGHVKLTAIQVKEHMALLTEGGGRSLLGCKHDPPVEGDRGGWVT